MSSWTAKAQPQTPTAQTNSTPFSWPNASLGNRATLVPLKGPPPVPHYLSAICPRNDSRSGPYNYPEPLDADPALQGFPAVCPVVAAREGLQGRRAGGRLWGQGPWSGVCPAPVRGRAWHPFRCGLTGRKSKALAWATCWPATCLPSDWKQPASSF